MVEMTQLIAQFGILIVIAGIFLFTTIADKAALKKREEENRVEVKQREEENRAAVKKREEEDRIRDDKKEEENRIRDSKYNESLLLLSKSSDNIASVIVLLKTSIEQNNSILKVVDDRVIKSDEKATERSFKIDEKLNEIKYIVNGCNKK